jgi:alpha-tubulin suppressor-like RCC1 family protein
MRTFGRSCIVLAATLMASCVDDDDASGPSSVVETVSVIPGAFSMIVGDTVRLTSIARGEVGNPIAGVPVVWESSSASVLTVSSTGLVTAVGAGAANITATVDGKAGIASVAVSPRFPPAAFASVTAGGAHTCGLTASGTAYCWGRDESGQLGVPAPLTLCLPEEGGFPCGLVPFLVDGGISFSQLTAGESHTCGLTSDGSAWCWGNNAHGQLGDDSFASRHAPVAVATSLKFVSIEAGIAHTCGLTSAGAAWCWGWNDSGQLGDGTTERRSTPVQVAVPAGVTFQQLAPGGGAYRDFTCGLAGSGTTYCWGSNARGQLGRGTQDFDPHPSPAPLSGNLTFTSIAAGFGNQACGLTSAGSAYCWGGNGAGELGDGSVGDSFQPVAVSGGIAFQKLAIGGNIEAGITCGLTSAGAAHCWGYNTFGSLGDGTTVSRRTPVAVTGGWQFESISVGMLHACARTVSGTLYCWGSGRTGQCGINYATMSPVPVKVSGQP